MFQTPTSRSTTGDEATVLVLDMAAVVHMVWPITAKTFGEYRTHRKVSVDLICFTG